MLQSLLCMLQFTPNTFVHATVLFVHATLVFVHATVPYLGHTSLLKVQVFDPGPMPVTRSML